MGGGIETRLAHAINGIAESMADTHDRAFTEVERAARYDRPLCVPAG